uniref:VENN motif pre-toxin domain-containing protein n=1 Tax=Cupriavidus sp. 2SB TaxID=2502199 RepID=UPI002018256E
LLSPTEGMSAEQKQARENAVQSLVAGVAGAVGGDAAAAMNAATFEIENNQLSPVQSGGGLPAWGSATPQKPFQIPSKPADPSEATLTGTPDKSKDNQSKPFYQPLNDFATGAMDIIFTPISNAFTSVLDSIVTKVVDSVSRPTPPTSEKDVGADLGPGHSPQVSYKDGQKVPYGTPGSVRPDHVADDGSASFEVKNYNVATNANGLINNVAKQAINRAVNLPAGMEQQIIIDVRGQTVSADQERALVRGIVSKSNGIISPESIEFKRN